MIKLKNEENDKRISIKKKWRPKLDKNPYKIKY